MAGIASAKLSSTVTVINPSGPANTRITFPLANTEQSYSFPVNTKRFCVMNKSDALIKVAWSSGDSGTNYFTIIPGATYPEVNVNASSLTIYWQSNKVLSGTGLLDALEVVSWS